MNIMRESDRRSWMRRLATVALSLVLLFGGLPVGVALAEEGAGPVEVTLEKLSELLQRLEGELAALKAPAAERLEDRLEEVVELIEGLLGEFDRPRDAEDGAGLKLRILRFDLMMHRLLYLLDEVVEAAEDAPKRPDAGEAIEGLRRWMNGYVSAMTAGMEPAQAERFEAAAHQMARELAGQLAGLARRVRPSNDGRPVLARLIERLEELLFRLDGFILQNFPAGERPPHRP